jgi:hypothetical protein
MALSIESPQAVPVGHGWSRISKVFHCLAEADFDTGMDTVSAWQWTP